MRAVIGALPAGAGAIALEGRSLAGMVSHQRARLGIGYMPEDRRIIPQLTVEENVLLPAWASGMPGAADAAGPHLPVIPEVAALKDRKGLQLSGASRSWRPWPGRS